MAHKIYKFSDIFEKRPDGSLVSKMAIELNGVVFPSRTVFTKGILFGGIDFYLYENKDIVVEAQEESEGGVPRVVGFV